MPDLVQAHDHPIFERWGRKRSVSGTGLGPRDYVAPRRDEAGVGPIFTGYDHQDTRPDLDRPAPYGNHLDEDRDPEEAPPPPYEGHGFGEREIGNMSPTRSRSSQARLPYPVIIPQRRPENKSRGWVTAYAPALEDFGIDQFAFLKFLHDFNEASKSSPYLDAVNLAAFGVGFVPGIAPVVVSIAVPMAVSFAQKTQTDRQTNSYLGRMNRDFLEPRGLFAIVMALKPGQPRSVRVDANSDSAAVVGRGRTGSGGYVERNRYEDTYRAPELPECAPLVYPTPQEIAEVRPRGNQLREMGHVAADYFDRRAQVQYMQRNPDSALAVRDVRFKSVWGDPRNVDQNTSLIGILSGGKVSHQNRNQDKRNRRGQQNDGRKQGGLLKSVKAMTRMNTDILYLMIAEKPSDDDMRALQTPPRQPVLASERTNYALQQDPYRIE